MSVKFKTKQKDIMAGYPYVIRVGYCCLQTLLDYKRPIAYTSGKDGWYADIYEIDPTTVIVTGYVPFGNVKPDYELVKQYENKAETYRYVQRGDNVPEHFDALLKDLVDKIITEYKEKRHE